jgi:hypothetical protein
MARKSKYHTHVEPKLFLIEGWARNGLTDEQISNNLGVAYSTFRKYRDQYPALSAALKKGKEVIDMEVENALLKRALGYRYKEITEEGGEVTKVVTKEVQPDTTAQIFWLRNRTNKWSNKDSVDIEKIKAETELTQERTKLYKGGEVDTSLFEELINVVKGDE